MEVIRNEAKIKRYRRISQVASLVGLAVLTFGLFLAFRVQDNPNIIYIQWVILIGGILLWQAALNVSWKYVRRPRPDEQLDAAVKAVGGRNIFYHFILPANHVLLTRSGPIVFVPKAQTGRVIVSGEEKDRWKRRGSLWRRFFGQEPALGNPTQEAEAAIGRLVALIKERAPDLDSLPIGAIIVFTSPRVQLEGESKQIPAVRLSELKRLVKKQLGRPLPVEQYRRLRTIFNEVAAEAQGGE